MKNEIQMIEWFNEHWYKIQDNGQTHWFASVTTKLGIIDKPQLARWRGDIGNREADLRMNEAGERGTRIHWAWATALQGGVVVYDPYRAPVYTLEAIDALKAKYAAGIVILRVQEEMVQIDKLGKQFAALKPKVLAVESKVYDLETKDAGTIDHVYEIQEGEYMVAGQKPLKLKAGKYVGDLKTGQNVYDEAYYQTAKYMQMEEKMTGEQCAGTLITHTSAKTKGGITGLTTILRTREQVYDEDLPMFTKIAAVWDAKNKDKKPEEFQFPALIHLGD